MIKFPDPLEFVSAFGCDYRVEGEPKYHLFLFEEEGESRTELAISDTIQYISIIRYKNSKIVDRFYHEGAKVISISEKDNSIGVEFAGDANENLRLYLWPVFRMEYSFLK